MYTRYNVLQMTYTEENANLCNLQQIRAENSRYYNTTYFHCLVNLHFQLHVHFQFYDLFAFTGLLVGILHTIWP